MLIFSLHYDLICIGESKFLVNGQLQIPALEQK